MSVVGKPKRRSRAGSPARSAPAHLKRKALTSTALISISLHISSMRIMQLAFACASLFWRSLASEASHSGPWMLISGIQ